MVRECRPPAREPGMSWLVRRSTMATSTPANANSPANISPVGPPPAITTACSVIAAALLRRERAGIRRAQLDPLCELALGAEVLRVHAQPSLHRFAAHLEWAGRRRRDQRVCLGRIDPDQRSALAARR